MSPVATAGITRSVVKTGLAYADLVAAFEREVPPWDPAAAPRLVVRHAPWSEVEQEVGRAAGPHGLMIVAKAEQGALVSLAGPTIRCGLYLVGNPVIAARILRIDSRASLFVPFRVALYEDGSAEGAIMAFDRPSSFLGALGRAELADLGALLDGKIDAVAAAVVRA